MDKEEKQFKQRAEFLKGESDMQCEKCGYDAFQIRLINYGLVFECAVCKYEHKWEQ